MIYHIAERDNDFTLRDFVKDWAPTIARRLQTINTYQLALATKMPLGTYLFTDLERQPQLQLELQAQIYDQLERAGGCQLYNHPLKSLKRFDLVRRLYDLDLNSYRAFRALEVPDDLRFPVFLRMEKDHGGSHTPLLSNWDEYEEAICRLALASRPPEEMLAIEYVDVAYEPGMFVKYSAFRIGDRIVPRGMFFSVDWMQKSQDKAPIFRAAEKWDYVQQNPHESYIMEVFRLANIEYGRVDYGISNGKIEVWEINTIPKFGRGEPGVYPQDERELQQWVSDRVSEAFIEIDSVHANGAIPVQLSWCSGCKTPATGISLG